MTPENKHSRRVARVLERRGRGGGGESRVGSSVGINPDERDGALRIYNYLISRNCFRPIRGWKLENLEKYTSKEISAFPFQTEVVRKPTTY